MHDAGCVVKAAAGRTTERARRGSLVLFAFGGVRDNDRCDGRLGELARWTSMR